MIKTMLVVAKEKSEDLASDFPDEVLAGLSMGAEVPAMTQQGSNDSPAEKKEENVEEKGREPADQAMDDVAEKATGHQEEEQRKNDDDENDKRSNSLEGQVDEDGPSTKEAAGGEQEEDKKDEKAREEDCRQGETCINEEQSTSGQIHPDRPVKPPCVSI